MSQSVTRAARILALVAAEPQSATALAERFGTHRSTMFRELQSLEQVGFVRRRDDGRYSPGLALTTLGQAALDQLDLAGAAHEPARLLHRAIGNTVHVGALLGREIVYVDKVEDAAGVRMYSRVGAAVHPNCSGLGKAILAELDAAGRDAVLAGCDWRAHTRRTLTSRAALDAELAATAARGWAADDGEFEDFTVCVAVPITTPAGVVGAISVTALRVVADLDQLARRVPALRETAAQIASRLA